MLPMVEILQLTLAAWEAVEPRFFQAAWLVCGYFGPDHFSAANSDAPAVVSVAEATHILDPAGVLAGTAIRATPQFCCAFEWQIQDRRCGGINGEARSASMLK